MAQAYEHASNLLPVFAEFDIGAPILIQIDKLVQLLESPIFTNLRLQLLEPDKYPYLLKALYGLLMILPQSSAFATLRNRLNAVSSLGFVHAVPKMSLGQAPTVPPSARNSSIRREELNWGQLLNHFRTIQLKHQRHRNPSTGVYSDEAIDEIEDPTGLLLTNANSNNDLKGVGKKKAVVKGSETGMGSFLRGIGGGGGGSKVNGPSGTASQRPMSPSPSTPARKRFPGLKRG